jgi:hypothetical protein
MKETAPRVTKDSEWREFERLVAVIEAEAVPRGATVKSPDLIRDLVTGQMREVDASIRFRAGTADILVTIECRKRKRIADDTWIEQLATKRQKLGAAKTIAVSSKGFTKSAIASAKHHGIELRKLSEISPEDVEDWFLPHGVVHLFRQVQNVRCSVKVEGQAENIDITDCMEPCFLHNLVHAPFPPVALVNFLELKNPKRFWSVPLDGKKTRLDFDLDATAPDLIPVPLGVGIPEKCRLEIKTRDASQKVEHINLSFDISYEAAVFAPEEGKHHLYEGEGGTIAQHTRFAGEVFGMPVTFDHQRVSKERPSATVEFPSGLRLDSNWAAIGPDAYDAVSTLTARPQITACRLCEQTAQITPSSVLPDYLRPDKAWIKGEAILCDGCAKRIAVWDDYGRALFASLPENLTDATGHALRIDKIDYPRLRLWMLSLMWRMSVASHPVWRHVDLADFGSDIKALLLQGDPGPPTRCPVGCVIPSFDGQRLDFLLEPDCVKTADGPLIRAALNGVIFMCSLRDAETAEELEPAYLKPDRPCIVPVVDWKDIDFLRDWIEGMLEKTKREAPGNANEPSRGF